MTMIENYMDEHMSAYTSFENNNVTRSTLVQSRSSESLEKVDEMLDPTSAFIQSQQR